MDGDPQGEGLAGGLKRPEVGKVLLVSNGHGEDLSGARLASALTARGLLVEALPLVGHGTAYRRAGIAVLGRTRQGSTGGMGYVSLRGRLTDLLEGQLIYVLARLGLLWRLRGDYRLVIGVGDVLAVLTCWLSGRPGAVYLVAYSSYYEGRLRLPWPCGWLLRRPRIRAIWSRDPLTAADLSAQLGRPVQFLGNPFVDGLGGARQPAQPGGRDQGHGIQVLLLPGSRMPEAGRNLRLMLMVLAALPAELRAEAEIDWRAALVEELGPAQLAKLDLPDGWQREGSDRLRCGGLLLQLGWDRFGAWLSEADLVLAAAGTATEQAVALALPVVQIVGGGPQFTARFAEAQRRLLGPAVACAPGRPGSRKQRAASVALIQERLAELTDPQRTGDLRQGLQAIARERLGPPGASQRQAEAIMALLAQGNG
jgi:uncharacterized protein (TIGR03492 family)